MRTSLIEHLFFMYDDGSDNFLQRSLIIMTLFIIGADSDLVTYISVKVLLELFYYDLSNLIFLRFLLLCYIHNHEISREVIENFYLVFFLMFTFITYYFRSLNYFFIDLSLSHIFIKQ